MTPDVDFKRQLEELSELVKIPPLSPSESDDIDAKRALKDEGRSLESALQEETLKDSQAARAQRETYAGRIFALV